MNDRDRLNDQANLQSDFDRIRNISSSSLEDKNSFEYDYSYSSSISCDNDDITIGGQQNIKFSRQQDINSTSSNSYEKVKKSQNIEYDFKLMNFEQQRYFFQNLKRNIKVLEQYQEKYSEELGDMSDIFNSRLVKLLKLFFWI